MFFVINLSAKINILFEITKLFFSIQIFVIFLQLITYKQYTFKYTDMATVLVQARIDSALKEKTEKYFHAFGMDTATAIRIFFAKVAETGSIPFTIGYDYNANPEISKEFSNYLLSTKKDIEQDVNILHFADNKEGFNYLESLMK
jgi:addiction module RelB/DinJ family antitoxin